MTPGLMHEVFTRLRFFLRRRKVGELDEELSFHIEQSTIANVAAGMSQSAARRHALIQFGSVERAREQSYQQYPGAFMSARMQDVRYALRGFHRNPLFTAAVVATLALGIGANAAMFTVLNGTLLRQLPYRAPDNLMTISAMDAKDDLVPLRLADIQELQRGSRSFESLAYHTESSAYIQAGGDEEISQSSISPNLFDLLGISPVLGRCFTAAEQQPGKSHVVILSDDLWRRSFHADPNILDKAVEIDGVPMTVVGVMPRRFSFPAGNHLPQAWTPADLDAKSNARDLDAPSFDVIGRRRNEISLAAAAVELNTIQRRLAQLYAGELDASLAPSRLKVEDYRASLTENERPALIALTAVVCIIWFIACANVANLMLARNASRERECAVRSALGASRWRLVHQLMIESLLLSVIGCFVGIAVAEALLQIFRQTIMAQIGIPIRLQPDLRVFLALFLLSVLSALTFSLAPAILASATRLDAALRQGGAQAGTGRGRQKTQRLLVVTEIGLSLAMLVACGLLLKTVFSLRHVPLGFRTDHVYILSTHLPAYKYRTLDANTLVYKPLLERIKGIHGVGSAAITTLVPLDKGFRINLELYPGAGTAEQTKGRTFTATAKATGPELQRVLGFTMLKGRYFDSRDTSDGPPVAVVNRAFVKAYEGGDRKTPIEDFSFGFGTERKYKIVGVIDDFHQAGIAEAALPEIDLNAAQMKPTDGFYEPTLQAHSEIAIRSSEDEAAFMPQLERVLHEFNPDLAANKVRTMDQIVNDSIGSQLLAAHLLEACGGLALIVALVGLFGLLAYLVSLRRRELGLRMALGAQREQILSLVLRQAGWLLAGGIALGLAISLATGSLLRHFLFGVQPRDISILSVATALMIVVGFAAAWIPARKASSIDPMDSLRAD
jgi:predicted permease